MDVWRRGSRMHARSRQLVYRRWATTSTPPEHAWAIVNDARWWSVVVLAGIAAGLIGIAITELLHLVQHVAFGYTEDTFLRGVELASPARRLAVLPFAGLVAGVGWWMLRRDDAAQRRRRYRRSGASDCLF